MTDETCEFAENPGCKHGRYGEFLHAGYPEVEIPGESSKIDVKYHVR